MRERPTNAFLAEALREAGLRRQADPAETAHPAPSATVDELVRGFPAYPEDFAGHV